MGLGGILLSSSSEFQKHHSSLLANNTYSTIQMCYSAISHAYVTCLGLPKVTQTLGLWFHSSWILAIALMLKVCPSSNYFKTGTPVEITPKFASVVGTLAPGWSSPIWPSSDTSSEHVISIENWHEQGIYQEAGTVWLLHYRIAFKSVFRHMLFPSRTGFESQSTW